jgi:hypothetical protein
VLLARKQDQLAAAAPTAGDTVTMKLVPGVVVAGRLVEPTATPADPRAARRMLPIITISARIGDKLWVRIAPVNASGQWRIADVMPGPITVGAEVETALGDTAAAITQVALTAPRPDITLELPAPRVVRVITRPAIAGVVVALPGERRATTWKDALALVRGVPQLSMRFAGPPLTRADGGARIGDAINLVGAPGPGPVTVCALPGARSPPRVPLPVLVPGPADTPPVCAVVPLGGDAIPTVVLTSR